MPAQQIILYTSKICPYAHRVEIALAETGATHKKCEIDLMNKPDWFVASFKSNSKIPALTYGPDAPPETPSPESIVLTESLILVEFIADLYPSSTILPADPVLRAKARIFIDVVSSNFGPNYIKFIAGKPEVTHATLLAGVSAIQDALPTVVDEAKGTYAIGDQFTIADIALAPMLARLLVILHKGIGAYKDEDRKTFMKALEDPKFNKFNAYAKRLLERESFKSTFDSDAVEAIFLKRLGMAK